MLIQTMRASNVMNSTIYTVLLYFQNPNTTAAHGEGGSHERGRGEPGE